MRSHKPPFKSMNIFTLINMHLASVCARTRSLALKFTIESELKISLRCGNTISIKHSTNKSHIAMGYHCGRGSERERVSVRAKRDRVDQHMDTIAIYTYVDCLVVFLVSIGCDDACKIKFYSHSFCSLIHMFFFL